VHQAEKHLQHFFAIGSWRGAAHWQNGSSTRDQSLVLFVRTAVAPRPIQAAAWHCSNALAIKQTAE